MKKVFYYEILFVRKLISNLKSLFFLLPVTILIFEGFIATFTQIFIKS
jgi:hypothetical protein